VLSELLSSYGVNAIEKLQGTLSLKPNPWWPWSYAADVWDPFFDFDRANVATVNQDYGAVHTVAQAKVLCRDAEGHSTYVGVYPLRPTTSGEYIDGGSGMLIAKDQTQANRIAESVYKQALNKNTAAFIAVGPVPWLKPCAIIALDWIDNAGDPDYGMGGESLWFVRSVTHRINFGSPAAGAKASEKDWVTTFECQTYSSTTIPLNTKTTYYAGSEEV
jgi:hypothetical protein